MSLRLMILTSIFACAGVGGCASKQSCCRDRSARTHAIEPVEYDRAVAASALLFDPPMYADELAPELAREGREPSAFVAYEDQTTTFSYIRIDDRQTGDDRERYERRAVIERFGSSTR